MSMTHPPRERWSERLDLLGTVMGSLVPTGLIIGNAGFESMMALTVVFWIARCFVARENPAGLVRHPIVLPWLAWLASVWLSLFVNGPGSKGWAHDVALLRFLLYVAALIDISGRRPVFRYLLAGMAAGVLWGLANTLLAYGFGYDIFGKPLARYSWKIKAASRIASLAAYAGPFFLAWGVLDSGLDRSRRVLVLGIAVIALAQIVKVNIRTVEVAAVAGIAAYLVYAAERYAGRWAAASLVGVGVVGAGLVIVFGPAVDLSSIYDRIGYWKVVWAMWKTHPLVGVSVSAWQDAYQAIAASDVTTPFIDPAGRSWKALKTTHAHSLFFHLISCTGLTGLTAFAWLFVNCVRQVLRRLAACGHALLTWPVVFLVIGLTGWNIYGSQYQTLLAYFAALTAVCPPDADASGQQAASA